MHWVSTNKTLLQDTIELKNHMKFGCILHKTKTPSEFLCSNERERERERERRILKLQNDFERDRRREHLYVLNWSALTYKQCQFSCFNVCLLTDSC
jgi:hypothetical protein